MTKTSKRAVRIKPTLRRNGLMMFSVKVEFTVCREHLIFIGTMKALNEEKLPETRYEWLGLLLRCLEENGASVTPDYLTDYASSDEEIAEAKALASRRIDNLFPDLQPPKAGG